MKICIRLWLFVLLPLLFPAASLRAQSPAFTYQGQLNDGANPANGIYDLQFNIINAASGGAALGSPHTYDNFPITNGFFTVQINADVAVFDGSDRWIEIQVRPGASCGAYTTLTPRQLITVTPYALHAENVNAAGISGTIPPASLGGSYSEVLSFDNAANSYHGMFSGSFFGLNFIGGSFSGSFIGNGSGLGNLNASQLLNGTVPTAALGNSWRTIGNAGTSPTTHFLGTTDNQPLEFRVNNRRILRLEPNINDSPNILAGSVSNRISSGVEGSTIAGGGIGLYPNIITASYATIGGGSFHIAGGPWSTIAGGRDNIVLADHSTIAGGHANHIWPFSSYSSIAGGGFNLISTNSSYSVVGGGYFNNVARDSFGGTIAGGVQNDVGQNSAYGAIGGGYENNIVNDSVASTIGGGFVNGIGSNTFASTVSGGYYNNVGSGSASAVISGGSQNSVGENCSFGTIGGGYNNGIGSNSPSATINGGSEHSVGSNSGGGVIGGGNNNRVANNSSYATVSGGTNNSVGLSSVSSAIGGGQHNVIGAGSTYSVISGGSANTNNAGVAMIGGGLGNTVQTNASYAMIGGGRQNIVWAGASYATIGGGWQNEIGASSTRSTIAGGDNNTIETNAWWGAIGGGFGNVIRSNAWQATIPGGSENLAGGNYSFAAGRRAKANHQSAFVWGDSNNADIASTNANSVTMRADGGYRLFSNGSATVGVFLAPGGSSWAVISDRNAKKDFAAVDTRTILEKLATLPITQWHYRWEEEDAPPHIGPMAQDFKAAFYPGRDDKSITTQEIDGVALAAIQGLNQKLEETRAENATLKQRLEKLEKLLLDRPQLTQLEPTHKQ
jgi:hypothetical protein